jgi:hypothetical protein
MMLDVYRGAVWGDFDQDLGVAGAAAQSTIGFIPVAGTLAALRDLFACIGQSDPLGIVLNLLAIFPVLGGFAKVTDAVHTLHRYHRAAKRRRQRALRDALYPTNRAGLVVHNIGVVSAFIGDEQNRLFQDFQAQAAALGEAG